MSLLQMDDFTYKHSSQVTPLYTSFTTAQVKSNFDSRGVELRTFINNLITTLNSLDGAGNISSTPIASGSGSTVHDQLVWLLGQIAAASSGTIVDGSIGEVKLSPVLAAKINNALSNEGLLSLLLTSDKSSLVNAINEVLTDLESLEGEGRTTETVKGVSDEIVNHKNDNTIHVVKDGTIQTGLNSDKIDGYDASSFVLRDSGTINYADINTTMTTGNYNYIDTSDSNSLWDLSVISSKYSGNDSIVQIAIRTNPSPMIQKIRKYYTGIGWNSWEQILTSSSGGKTQSGTVTTSATSAVTNVAVTFPTAFSSTPIVVITPQAPSGSTTIGVFGNTLYDFGIYNISTTGFILVSNQNQAVTYNWIAIGS